MRLIKLGLINHNAIVGAFDTNVSRMVALAKQCGQDCHLVAFPEGAVSGYPCEDLVLWPSFTENQWPRFERLAAELGQISPQTVYTFGGNALVDGHVFNVIAVATGGKVVGIVPKMFLADGNVFYDSRSTDQGIQRYSTTYHGVPFGDLLFQTPFGLFGPSVCEDIWAANSPIHRQAFAGAELLVNQSASPFRSGIVATREELLATRSAESQAVLLYVNLVGANDALNFDGGGYVFQNGRRVHSAKRWQRQGYVSTAVVDLDLTRQARLESNTWRRESRDIIKSDNRPAVVEIAGMAPSNDLPYPSNGSNLVFLPTGTSTINPLEEYFEDLIEGMVMGLGDYMDKIGRFIGAASSLSGGQDSVLSAYITWVIACRKFEHLPKPEQAKKIHDFVWCVSQPTPFNSPETRSVAKDFADVIGATFIEEPIEEAFIREVEAMKRISGTDPLPGNTEQNIQARIRGARMWNLANARHLLFVYTGNMSEISVGYTTIGGDQMGAYGPIKNAPKTVVTALLQYIAKKHGWECLHQLLKLRPSAELKENQTDEADLMPYPVLDACYNYFAGKKVAAQDLFTIVRSHFTDEDLRQLDPGYRPGQLERWVEMFPKMFLGAVFKWVFTPLGAHLGSTDFDREGAMRIPIVQWTEWLDPS